MTQLLLMSLMEKITHLCRMNKLSFWIDFGTLLGEHRHKNIIPWDYDIDMCMCKTNYIKLIELFKNQPITNLYCDVNYYNNVDGCLFISDKKGDDIGIDVVCYIENNNMLQNTMSKEILQLYVDNYDHLIMDIFPNIQVPFCGNYVNIPKNPIKILESEYGSEFMSIPFEGDKWLLSNSDKFMSCPFIEVDIRSNIINSSITPYIIRNCSKFKFELNDLINSFLSEDPTTMWGYTDISKIEYEFVPPSILIDDWNTNKLKHILVDTVCTNSILFPEEIGDNMKCYTLTKTNNLTEFHIDPDYGGGWMYLKLGIKLWWFISPYDMEFLSKNGITLLDLAGKNFTELLQLCDNYLWGKIYIGEARATDFIYFPRQWAHRVYTYDKSIGLSGYLL